MTNMDLQAELQRLQEENSRLKNAAMRSIHLKVSQKGGVSLYGLGRFPVTLYREQWERLLEHSDAIREFIEAHSSELKSRQDS